MADIYGPQPAATHPATYYESVLTGLAFLDAHRRRDADALASLIETGKDGEALLGVLDAAQALIATASEHPHPANAEDLSEALRARVLRDYARL